MDSFCSFFLIIILRIYGFNRMQLIRSHQATASHPATICVKLDWTPWIPTPWIPIRVLAECIPFWQNYLRNYKSLVHHIFQTRTQSIRHSALKRLTWIYVHVLCSHLFSCLIHVYSFVFNYIYLSLINLSIGFESVRMFSASLPLINVFANGDFKIVIDFKMLGNLYYGILSELVKHVRL